MLRGSRLPRADRAGTGCLCAALSCRVLFRGGSVVGWTCCCDLPGPVLGPSLARQTHSLFTGVQSPSLCRLVLSLHRSRTDSYHQTRTLRTWLLPHRSRLPLCKLDSCCAALNCRVPFSNRLVSHRLVLCGLGCCCTALDCRCADLIAAARLSIAACCSVLGPL